MTLRKKVFDISAGKEENDRDTTGFYPFEEFAPYSIYCPQVLSRSSSLKSDCLVTFYNTIRLFTTLRKKAFENIVGKGENAGNQHFLLFPAMFSFLLFP